jgi:hypothetical protein
MRKTLQSKFNSKFSSSILAKHKLNTNEVQPKMAAEVK